MREIEIKLRVDNLQQVAKTLCGFGYVVGEPILEIDKRFTPHYRGSSAHALRIREAGGYQSIDLQKWPGPRIGRNKGI